MTITPEDVNSSGAGGAVPLIEIAPGIMITYEEFREARLMVPAENPDWRFTLPTAKLKGKKTSTEILMEMRAEERY